MEEWEMRRSLQTASAFGWLFLACQLLLLSGGDLPVEPAVWLGPVVLLRFVRAIRPWIGLPLALVCLTVTSLTADRGMLPMPTRIAIIVTVISSAYAILPYAADRLFASFLPMPVRTLLFPVAAVAVQTLLSGGGTWDNIAYGIRNIYVLQLTSVLGLKGIVFLVYWTAAVLNEIWEHRSHLSAVRGPATVYIAVMLAVYGFGVWRLDRSKPVVRSMHVAGVVPGPGHRETMIQAFGGMVSPGGGGNGETGRFRTVMDDTFERLLAESVRLAVSGAEMVLWSEGAVVVLEADEESYIARASAIAREHGIHLGIGVVVLKASARERGEPFIANKLILVSPDGTIGWEYMKSNLAPGLERQFSIRGDCVLRADVSAKGTITGAICYDMDFPAHIRQAGAMNADLLLAPANDWPEIKETHWRMARMRAIENGVSILRPSSSGVSTAVDPYGRIVSRVDYFQSGGSPFAAVLPVGSVGTVYAGLGDSWTWVCVVGAAFMIVLSAIRWGAVRRTSSG